MIFPKKSLVVTPFLLLLLFIPSVNADLTINSGYYLDFSEQDGLYANDSTTFGNNFSSSNDSVIWDSSGKIGGGTSIYIDTNVPQGGYRWDSEPTVADQTARCLPSACHNFSFSAWIYPESLKTNQFIMHQEASTGNEHIASLIYDAGFIKYQGVTGSSGSRQVWAAASNPVFTQEWSHVVVTVNDSYNVTMYINGDKVDSFNIDGSSSIVGDDTGFEVHLGYGRATNLYFNGSLDEIGYWDSYVLTDEDAEALYNNGNGLSFVSFDLEAPEQILTFAPISMGQNDQELRFMNQFFSGYNDFTLSFTDEITGNNVFLEIEDTSVIEQVNYTTPYLNVEVLSMGETFQNNVRVKFNSNVTSFETFMVFCAGNSIAQACSLQVPFSILGIDSDQVNNPKQIKDFKSPFKMSFLADYQFDMNDYFSGYDGIKVIYTHPVTGVFTTLQTEKDQTTVVDNNIVSVFSLVTDNDTIRFRVFTNETQKTIPLTIGAFYEVTNGTFSTILDTMSLQIGQFFGDVFVNPPTKIKDIGTLQLDSGDSVSIFYTDYMTDFTGSSIDFEDGSNGLDVNLINGQTYEQGNFTVSIVKDKITITAISSSYEQEMFMGGVNQAGDLIIPFTVSIGGLDIGQSSSTGKGIFRSIVSWVTSLFPNSETIPFGTRMAFVFSTILGTLILFVLLGGLVSHGEIIEPLIKYVFPVVAIVEVLFFIANGYIPISLIIVLTVIAGAIGFLATRGSS